MWSLRSLTTSRLPIVAQLSKSISTTSSKGLSGIEDVESDKEALCDKQRYKLTHHEIQDILREMIPNIYNVMLYQSNENAIIDSTL